MIAKGKGSDQRRKQKRKVFSWLMVLCMVLTMFTPQFASANAGDTPAHSKTIHDNGDGTYNLELSVTGDADDETQEAGKVNIVVIYDTSSSMTSNAQGSNYTRADQAEDVVHDFLANLATYQNDARDNINVALVTFARTSNDQGSGWTTNVTGIANRFDDGGTDRQTSRNYSGTAANGTNWESAIDAAVELVRSAPGGADVPTFVIMMTDGACTASGNGNNAINPSGASIGQLRPFYTAATDEAYALAQACEATGGTFYGIYAYGTEADLLDDLMYFSENNQHRGGSINNVVAATQDAPNFFRAADTSALNTAITEIFNEVVNSLGISSVSISDGTTNQVTTGTGVSELLEVDGSSYKYWISIPVVNNQFTRKMNVVEDGVSRVETVTYTVTDNGDGTCRVNWTEGGSAKSVTVSGSVSSGNFKYQWTASNDLYKYNPPAARLVNGSVEWNLSSVGTLLDGVTYSVTFDVYPSQETLDDVADIKNNPGPNGAWKDLDPAVQQYIDVNGNLKTNTTATLTYSDTRLENPGPKTSTYTNPDPVKNSAVEQMAVTKEWDNALEDEWEKPESIVLNVTRDDDPHYTVTLADNEDPDKAWKGSVYVSIGIMGENGQPLQGSEGHDFTFTEPTIQGEGFKWEIDAPTVHPMLINNVPTMLIKVDDKHPAPGGATTYSFNDATYYVGEEDVALTATNERRSSLNLKKVVDGEDAPEDAVFPFTLHVNDSLAPATAPSETEDPNHDSDYWIWISVRDKDGNRINEGVGGATSAGSGWWYAPNDTDVTIPVKDGYSIRVNNLPVGSTYKITEGDVPAGFVFESAAIAFTDGRQPATDWTFSGGQTSTGSINTTNAVYTVTYKNTYELVDVNVDKVWSDASDQDGLRPDTLALTLNGAPDGTTVPEPLIEPSEDGNTWTYTWKGLPRFDAQGNEIAYTVTEEDVPKGYECSGSPAADGGTITNTHEPEETSVSATKVWDDNDDQDGKRPDTITLRLYKVEGQTPTLVGDDGEPKTIAKDATGDDLTVTWTDLPKNENGSPIQYTVLEDEIDAARNYTTTVEGDMENGFTVTNVHVPETTTHTVTKVWDDGDDKYQHRPPSIQVTLLADGEPYGDPVTVTEVNKEWTYTWTDLPVYEDGSKIEYKATEERIPYYDEPIINHEAGSNLTEIINRRDVDETTYMVVKVWDDAGNQDGVRPGSIMVQLYQSGKAFGDPVELTGTGDQWQYTWTGLEKNNYEAEEVTEDTGNKSKAAPAEEKQQDVPDVDQSEESVEEPAAAEEETLVESADEVNADDAIVDQDAADESSNETVEAEGDASEEEQAAPEKRNAPVRAAAKALELVDYVYTADEVSVPTGYEKTSVVHDPEKRVSTITNKHTPEVTSITITKEWDDNKNQDGIRLTDQQYAAVVQLLANGEVVEDAAPPAVTDNGDGTYTVTYSNLPKNKGGQEITYAVKEDVSKIPGYTTENDTAENGGTIINKHIPEKDEITVTKIWVDADNQDGKRPNDVTFTVTGSDGKTYTTTFSGSGNTWKDTIEVEKYYDGGKEVTFEVDEATVTGYSKKIDNPNLTITNTYTPETANVEITKQWEDADNQDGIRPTASEFKAKLRLWMTTEKDGKEEVTSQYVDKLIVTDNGDGTYTVSVADLPMFKPGSIGSSITWTISEDTIAEYEAVDGITEVENGGTIVNKHEPELIPVEITKKWDDANDQDGYRLTAEEFKAKVHLFADGTEVEDAEATVTDNGDGTYTVTYTDLPKNKRVEGKTTAITYTVKEDTIPEYTTEDDEVENGGTIINKHVPEKVDVTGIKHWEGEKDEAEEALRPESITVNLLADGDPVVDEEGEPVTATVTANDDWEFEFTDLPKYKEKGTKIVYTVTEDPVDGYKVSITNPKEVTEDPDDPDSKVICYEIEITNTIDVRPRADGAVLNIKKVDENNVGLENIEFTLNPGEGSEADPIVVKTDDKGEATIDIPVEGWLVDDERIQDEFEFELTEDVPTGYKEAGPWTVTVKPEGDAVYTLEVETADDGTKSSYFDRFIQWVVNEVEGGTYTYEGKLLTIKNEREKIDLPVEKVWEEEDPRYDIRPDSITVNLLADGKATEKSLELSDENEWKDTFVELDKYSFDEKGEAIKEIEYTVDEVEVAGYETAITGSTEDGYTITNTMKFGDVRITKDLLTYEDSSQATFVYSVKATVEVAGKDDPVVVYDGVVTLDFTSATTASAVIKDLPAGAVVEVEELYSGAAYDQKSGPEWEEKALDNEAEVPTVIAKDEIGVEFSNAYDGELVHGYGILNEYEAEGGSWVHLDEVINSNDTGDNQ